MELYCGMGNPPRVRVGFGEVQSTKFGDHGGSGRRSSPAGERLRVSGGNSGRKLDMGCVLGKVPLLGALHGAEAQSYGCATAAEALRTAALRRTGVLAPWNTLRLR